MEIKKSPKADLEKGKMTSLLMGMVVGLAILFVAFEWSNRDVKVAQDQGVADVIAEEQIEITRPENTPPPPPPIVVSSMTVSNASVLQLSLHDSWSITSSQPPCPAFSRPLLLRIAEDT